MVIHSSVAVFVQQFLHTAECDGGEVTGVLQLEETLQVRRCLTPGHVHTLTVHSIKPGIKIISCVKCVYDCTKGRQQQSGEAPPSKMIKIEIFEKANREAVIRVCESSPAVDDRQDV